MRVLRLRKRAVAWWPASALFTAPVGVLAGRPRRSWPIRDPLDFGVILREPDRRGCRSGIGIVFETVKSGSTRLSADAPHEGGAPAAQGVDRPRYGQFVPLATGRRSARRRYVGCDGRVFQRGARPKSRWLMNWATRTGRAAGPTDGIWTKDDSDPHGKRRNDAFLPARNLLGSCTQGVPGAACGPSRSVLAGMSEGQHLPGLRGAARRSQTRGLLAACGGALDA